ELVAVQRHPCLQPQRIAGGQPGGPELSIVGGRGPGPRASAAGTRWPGLGERHPQVLGVLWRAEDLEAVLSGVPGPGDPGWAAGDLNVSPRVVLHAIEGEGA